MNIKLVTIQLIECFTRFPSPLCQIIESYSLKTLNSFNSENAYYCEIFDTIYHKLNNGISGSCDAELIDNMKSVIDNLAPRELEDLYKWKFKDERGDLKFSTVEDIATGIGTEFLIQYIPSPINRFINTHSRKLAKILSNKMSNSDLQKLKNSPNLLKKWKLDLIS